MKIGDNTKMTNNDKVPELSGKEFDNFISKGYVFIDFFAEWCMPCLMMSPVIDELSAKFNGKIKFGKVNVDDNQQLAGKYKVQSIPNMILFKDGKQINQFIGGISSDELEDKLKKSTK